MLAVRLPLALVLLVACAPTIDGPIERQRAADLADSDRLAAQLAQLPGAVRAHVTLHRAVVDPLTRQATQASAAVLIVVDDGADRRAITRSARALVRGTAPEITEPSIAVELGAVRPTLAHVGPLAVAASSRRPLVAAFALAFAVIAGLAGVIAWRERWRVLRG